MAIDREKVLQAAQKLVEKKKYDKAVQEYQKLIAEDPNDARTLLKIGDLQSKMEAYPEAISTYERVGKYYAQQGFALKAIAVYKQIRELIAKHAPQLEERYGHIAPKLAELYQQLGLTSDALAALDEVATRLQRQNKDQDAIDVFRKIVDLDPTNPLPHLRLAEALSRIKDVDGAVAEFGLAASQLVRLGRRDDALKVIERLLHHKPDPAHARIAAELYLARNGQNDGMQALAKLQICFQANPKDLDTLALLARAFAAIGQGAKGIEVQKEMAKIAREQGKMELFKQLIEKLQRAAPNDEGVRQLVASARGEQAAAPAPTLQQPSARDREPAPSAREPARSAPSANAAATTANGRRPSAVAPPPPPPPPPRRASAAPVEELEYDNVVETSDIDEVHEEVSEEPFALRSERPQPARARESSAPELLVEGDQLEVAEEEYAVAEEAQADINEQLAQALADAASFRRVRLYPKAIETLRIGLELEPRSLDLREFLRDVLIEANRIQEAVEEMLTLASLYVDSLDGDAAARALQDVLAYDPQNYRARAMLNELGYEVIDEPEEAPVEPYAPAEPQPLAPPTRTAYGGYDEAPLPSYDLEEIGPADASNAYSDPSLRAADERRTSRPAAMHARGALGEIDDPFGADASAPLPSFPLDAGPESEAAFELGRSPDDTAAAPATAGFDEAGEPATDQVDVVATPPAPELEEALEEADFFVSRGLYDDARNILNEQLSRLPSNPLVRERLAELDGQEQAAKRGGSGTRQMPREVARARTSAPPASAGDGDRAFDIAASLDALEQSDKAASPAFGAADQQVDVEEVFAKFKEGVAKQISVDDAQSHYDLGVAYKEMGLLDDAVREFDVAARDPKRECICRSMIGMIQVERGNVNEAIDAFMRGLAAKVRTPEQEVVLWFEVGACYEQKKMNAKALEFYKKVIARDPEYRDALERVRRLSGASKPMRQAAVGADDDFDRAFDEILGGGKP